MSAQGCQFTEDQVLAYVAGDGSEEETLEMALHLADCPACLDQAVEFRTLEACLDGTGSAAALRWSSFDSPFGTM